MQKQQALAGEPVIHTDGVLGQELKIAAVSSTGFPGGRTLVENNHTPTLILHSVAQVVGRRSARQTGANDDDMSGLRQYRLGAKTFQRMIVPKPERLVVLRDSDREIGVDTQTAHHILQAVACAGGECAISLDTTQFRRY